MQCKKGLVVKKALFLLLPVSILAFCACEPKMGTQLLSDSEIISEANISVPTQLPSAPSPAAQVSEEGDDFTDSDSSELTTDAGPPQAFTVDVDDFQGYLGYLDWLPNANYYYTVRFERGSFPSYGSIPLASLKDMYAALNESFDFVLETTQSLYYIGYYDGDISFVDAGPDGMFLDHVLNQRTLDGDGSEYYTTPLFASLLGVTIYHQYDNSIVKGRNFTDADFELNSPDETVNAIFGFDYLNIYDIGDIVRLSLYFEEYDFKVIGFFGEGAGICSGLGALDEVVFDNRIITPFFNINYDPDDDDSYVNHVIHYSQMTQGNICITEPLDDISDDTYTRYLTVVQQIAEMHGLPDCYYMPLWPVAITIQR